LHRVVTRIYFSDDPSDPVLSSVDPARRHTLIATPVEGGYTFDIRLQGAGETVFFEV
jgi:protocatechuate 3,4-dioxygenase, alpha subunit